MEVARQKRTISLLGGVGSLLLTFGTLCLHAAFSASQRRLALVSDVLQDWPLAGSLTFGVGNTMMGLSLYGSQSLCTLLACMLSAWVVVGSSDYHEQEWIRTVHWLATAAFIVSSYVVFTGAVQQKQQQVQEFAGALSAILFFLSGLALASAVALVGSKMSAAEERQSASSAYSVWRNTVALCEVGLLAVYGVGYVNVFFF